MGSLNADLHVTGHMQSKSVTDVAYVDFNKAFDSVSYDKLLIKIAAYGISGSVMGSN